MVAKNMRNVQVFILCLLAVAVLPMTALAKVTARIDRNSMAIDETLSLTLSKDGSSFFSGPELDPLEKDFKVLGQSKSSTTSIVNGSATSTAEWHIVLAPRRTGTLVIPPITVSKEKSNPLTVQVRAATQPKTKADNVPIFIESDVDSDSVYVQSQIILTLRLYWAVEARITEPDDPQLENALIKRLDDTTFDKTVKGQSYKVFERKYAIFPQKSGTLKIPPQVVEIMVPSKQRSHSFFDPFGSFGTTGEKLRLRSEAKTIQVKEKPPEYPVSDVWLPASTVLIKDRWNTNLQKLSVGDSSTLTITLTADGLTGEQLPPIELPETEGLKLYQGKAEVDNKVAATGIVGIRQESIALIPTKAGTYELPEIRIPWWNKESNKIEYAVIPARKLTVQGTVAENTMPEKSAEPVESPVQNKAETLLPPASAPKGTAPTVWIIVSSVLAAGWLITLFVLIQTRRKVSLLDTGAQQKLLEDIALKEKQAFADVSRACHENNAVAARNTVTSWLRTYLPDAKIQTFSDVEKYIDAPDFLKHLQVLDKILYDPTESNHHWQGNHLLEQVKELRKNRAKTKKTKKPLEELYR